MNPDPYRQVVRARPNRYRCLACEPIDPSNPPGRHPREYSESEWSMHAGTRAHKLAVWNLAQAALGWIPLKPHDLSVLGGVGLRVEVRYGPDVLIRKVRWNARELSRRNPWVEAGPFLAALWELKPSQRHNKLVQRWIETLMRDQAAKVREASP